MLYKVTERVEEEYGPHDHTNMTNLLEPVGIVSTIAVMFYYLFILVVG